MKLSRKWLLIASLVLSVAMATGGTLAYLTDTESDHNVMTVGSVDIEQLEYERIVNENGEWVPADPKYDFESADHQIYKPDAMQEFTQGKPAVPAVYQDGTTKWDDRNGSGAPSHMQPWTEIGAPGYNQLFDDSMKNVIDKFVFVKNSGRSDAYYRTLVAIEVPNALSDEDIDLIHTNFNGHGYFDYDASTTGNQGPLEAEELYVELNGGRYLVYNVTYTQVLEPNEISRPSLLQLFLNPAFTNEQLKYFGDTWDVLVLSQAVQADGFTDAHTALESGFGKATKDNVASWFAGMAPEQPKAAKDADELGTALVELNKPNLGEQQILLGADITNPEAKVTAEQQEGTNLTIDGNGRKFSGTLYLDGNAEYDNAEQITIQNFNFVYEGNGEAHDFISCDTTDGDKRYAHNVTIKNCTFTGSATADVVGLRLRQCFNITIEDCTATNMHSLMWATGGKGFTVDGVTLTNCKNGISFGTADDVVVKNSKITTIGDYGYGIRADANGAYKLTLKNNVINSAAPVLLRKATGNYQMTMEGVNTLLVTNTTANSNPNGYQIVVTGGDFENGIVDDCTAPTSCTIKDGDAYKVFGKEKCQML